MKTLKKMLKSPSAMRGKSNSRGDGSDAPPPPPASPGGSPPTIKEKATKEKEYPPLPTLHVHHIEGMPGPLAVEALLRATVLAGLPLTYTFSQSNFTEIGSDDEKHLSSGSASKGAPWMIVSEMRGAGAVLSGVVDIVSYIHELHKLYDVNVDSLITHGACIAPNTSILPDPLSFPQTLQFLDQLVHVDMLIALTVFTEFPESFFNTKVLPHFGGSMAKNLYKSLSDINGQKQSLKDAQLRFFQQMDDRLNFSNLPFLMGNTFTVADLYLFFLVAIQVRSQFNIAGYPMLLRWYDEVASLPCVEDVWPAHWEKDVVGSDSGKSSFASFAANAYYEQPDLALTPLQQAVELLQTLRDNTADPATSSRTRRVTSAEAISYTVSDVLTLLSEPRKVNTVDIHRMRDLIKEEEGGQDADAVMEQFDYDDDDIMSPEEQAKRSATVVSSNFKRRISSDALGSYPGIGRAWTFDVRSIKTDKPLATVAGGILAKTDLLSAVLFKGDGGAEEASRRETRMKKFIEAIEGKYCNTSDTMRKAGGRVSNSMGGWEACSMIAVPYHNAYHAADTTNAIWVLMSSVNDLKLTGIELFAGFISAMFHDVGHEGVNNNYLIHTRDKLALTYNDSHVLENMHLATAFEVARSPECDFFETMGDGEYKAVRKLCIGIVLATDLAVHFDTLSALKSDVKNSSLSNQTVLKTCMKMADLSHGSKGFSAHEDWSLRICKEFYNQGDAEKEAGMKVIALFDRALEKDLPKNQVGFLKYLVEPLFNTVKTVFMEELMGEILGNIESNSAEWSRQAEKKEEGEDK